MKVADFKEGAIFLVGKSPVVNTVTNVFPEDIPGSGCFDVGLRTFGSNKSCNAEIKGKRIRLYDTLGPVFGTAFTRWMDLSELHLLPEVN